MKAAAAAVGLPSLTARKASGCGAGFLFAGVCVAIHGSIEYSDSKEVDGLVIQFNQSGADGGRAKIDTKNIVFGH